jgi:hypothetical protein
MKKDWKKDRAAAAKHARLVKRKPELRAALYGRARDAEDAAGSRETAHKEGYKDG